MQSSLGAKTRLQGCNSRGNGRSVAFKASRTPLRSSDRLPQASSHEASTSADRHPMVHSFAASITAGMLMMQTFSGTAIADEMGAAYAQQPQAETSRFSDPETNAYVEREEKRFDDYLQTPELRDLLSMLDKGKYNLKELEAARLKVGFRRDLDGRVSLQTENGRWYSIKSDMQTPGFLLLRDQEAGAVYYLPPDEGGRLLQIDLSDDMVVGQLFGSRAWQDVMEPLQAEDVNGRIVPLILDEADFRGTLSLLEDALEQEEL